MADAVKITVEARDPAKNKGTGTRVSRRLRATGRIPAIVYGHKEGNTPVSLARDSIWEMLKKSSHLAELSLNGTTETVIVRDIQWDYLGKEILHVDFARVSADETIETEVRLELRGTAPGVVEGGVLDHAVHNLHVRCRANAIPDSIRVDVSNLHLGASIHTRDLTLPEGVTALGDPDLVLIHVIARTEAADATETEGQSQPEVIKPERREKED